MADRLDHPVELGLCPFTGHLRNDPDDSGHVFSWCVLRDGIRRMINEDVPPASADAIAYFQTIATRLPIPSSAGRPAYQSAGIERIHADITQATAIPTGPQGSHSTNSNPITVNSMIPQRSKRSGLPSDRWIQL